MRIVAKVQFTSEEPNCREDATAAIDTWADDKYLRHPDGNLTIRRSGAQAIFEKVNETAGHYGRTHFSMLEPINGGSLQTDVRIVSTPSRTAISTVLSLGSDHGIAPLNISLRVPKFVRAVVSTSPKWTVGIGGEHVLASSVTATTKNLDELQTLIEYERRRLPIILVSEYDGRTLAGDLHEIIAADLCGLAHVVRLTTEGAWELTKRWGAVWSCYNGAVRLLWPMRGGRGDPWAHPLWTMDRLMARTNDEIVARDQLRHAIGHRILEASTYVPDDAALAEFVKASERAHADYVRASLANQPDRSKEAYEEQIASQRAEIDRQDAEIRDLKDNIESLSIALRTMRPADRGSEDEQTSFAAAEPQSVAEAVATARRELTGKVEIACETDTDIADLNPEAGPPEKILRYLRTMGALADRLAEGPLGLSVPKWLRERGVECSGDSETTKNSAAGKKFRTRLVNGRAVDCEFHAKPTEGTSPDRCARIYFGTSQEAPYVRVGYIGRHTA